MLPRRLTLSLWFSILAFAVSEPEYQPPLSTSIMDPRTTCKTKSHSVPNHSPDHDPIAPDRFIVRFNTTVPESEPIVLEVVREWSPLGVDRFYQLVLDDFYTCCAFFRVVPNFVVQFGIASEPQETAKWRSSTIADDPVIQSNTESYVSFATAGPNTRTTQLFINTRDNIRLDNMGFSPFARVIQGMDTVERILNPIPPEQDHQDGIDQAMYEEGGNEWLLEAYPNVDLILGTEILDSNNDITSKTSATSTMTTTSTMLQSKLFLAGSMILEVLAFCWMRKRWT